jgi:hypothetical protein
MGLGELLGGCPGCDDVGDHHVVEIAEQRGDVVAGERGHDRPSSCSEMISRSER